MKRQACLTTPPCGKIPILSHTAQLFSHPLMLQPRLLLNALAALLAPALAFAEPFDLPLYDGPPPGAPLSSDPEVFVKKEGDPIARVTHVQTPDIRVFLPPKEKATGASIVIYPGGAYRILAIDHEGWQIAEWLNSIGVAGIVCKYRVSDRMGDAYHHPVPLLDARQAVRLTRQHAAEWGLDPERMGVMGFSAGGHLASTMLTMADVRLPGEPEEIFAQQLHKPNFGVLVYPVISFTAPFAHRGSGDNLLGPNASEEERKKFSTELLVNEHTPPTFLVSTQDDTAVPYANSAAFYRAMTRHGVKGELHVWEKGGHGFGILPGRGPVSQAWPRLLADWMESQGWLKR